MDAVKYLEERHRMCKFINDCGSCAGCPFTEISNCENEPCEEVIYDYSAEQAVKIVEKWSAENPVRTRADVFREMFPHSAPYSIYPCLIDRENNETDCRKCERHHSWSNCDCVDYWNAPAPENFGKGGKSDEK